MARAAETTGVQKAAEEVLRELNARRGTLTNGEIFDLMARIPWPEVDWSSADVIRELRGPLPEDDPDFKNVDRR